MSGKNPFRKQPSEVTTRSPSPPLPAIPQRTPSPPLPAIPTSSLPDLPPRPSPSAIPSPSNLGVTADIAPMGDEDDLPPPYTPAANAGEETVGLGPLRPFQRAPPAPPSSLNPPSDARRHPNWTPPPAQAPSFSQPPAVGPNTGYYYPQPQPQPAILAPWQTQQRYRNRQNAGGGLLGALFDTVRDIADAVSGAHDQRMMAAQNANVGAYAAPYARTGSSAYAPSPQMPAPAMPPPRPASTPPRSPPSTIPDDGSPTRTPVPGHPLLRDGHLLVYPRDHLCVKCKNTGYKNYDPNNPCRKCWDKYGRSYTGALIYTPWSPADNDPRMQRPLPKFVPPHMATATQSHSTRARSGYSYPPQHPQHNRSASQPHSHPQSPGMGASYYVTNPVLPYSAPPVPNAIAVSPGDPRLGGRLCTRCGGEGVRVVMLIDVAMCEDCSGTGRVWR